ncbi:MAG: FAD binding domain-containing protein [Candidatus Dormibacteraceae bacterium]
MKPAPFTYTRPRTVEEALAALARGGEEGRVLAGGQSLVPMMNFRLARPEHLVDISRVADLDFMRTEGDWLVIGAATRQVTLEQSVEALAAAPLLVEAVTLVGHAPIRHRGTVCGSIAHAEPAAELPAAALALGAVVVLEGREGSREIALEDFLIGPYETAIRTGELVRELRVRCWPPTHGSAFVEYSRRYGDFAIAGAAVALDLGREGTVDRGAIALCGVAPTAVRANAAEAALLGKDPHASTVVDNVASLAVTGLHPSPDVHGSSEYRVRVARTCAERALEKALRRASEGRVR